MSCTHEQNDLLDWLDGALSEAEAARVQAQVEGCEFCRAEWEALRDAMAWADGALPLSIGEEERAPGFTDQAPPASLHENLMRAAQAQLEGRDPVEAISSAQVATRRTDRDARQSTDDAPLGRRLWAFLTGLNTGGLALATASAVALVAATSWWMQEKDAQREALAFPETLAPDVEVGELQERAEASAEGAPTKKAPTDEHAKVGATRDEEVTLAPPAQEPVAAEREQAQIANRRAKRPEAPAAERLARSPKRETPSRRRSRAVSAADEGFGALEALAASPEVAGAAGASVEPSASSGGGGRGRLATGLAPETGALRADLDKSADLMGSGASPGRASRAPARAESAPAPAPRAASLENAAQKILSVARTARSQGACARAIPLYQRLVESDTYRDTPTGKDGQVALELAACYARTGRTAEATRTVRLAQSRRGIRDAALLASVKRDLAERRAAEAREVQPAAEAEAAAEAEK